MSIQIPFNKPEDLEKIRSIIDYFTYKMGGKYLSTRRLMKLYYTAELKSIEKLGRRLSSATFLNWNYGPWSPNVSLVADMSDTVRVEAKEPTDKYPGKRYVPALEETEVNLSKKEMEILDEVIVEWKYKNTDTLVKKTKISAPFIWSEHGQKIDFEKLIECYKKTYGNKILLSSIKKSRREIAQDNIFSITSERELEAFVESL